jgi:hypothetical protein
MAGYKFGNKANFGENTTLSGSFQTVFGSGNSNSADYTMVGGISNTAASTAEESLVWGSGSQVSGSNNLVIGGSHVVENACDFNIVGGTTCSGMGGGFDGNLMVGGNLKSTNRYNLTVGTNNINDTDFNGMGSHIVGGKANTLSGSNFGLMIGSGNTGPLDFHSGIQMGQEGDVQNNKYGAISTAAGKFAAVGDAQLTTHLVYRGQTTNNTATVIYNSASSSTAWALAANDSVIVKATVIGRKAGDAGQSAAYEVIAAFKNQGGTSTIGTTGVTKRVLNEDTGTTNYDATLAVNNTDDTFELKVTGDTGHNVNWMAHVEVMKLNVA